jgi:hypothetical protein
VRSTELAQSHPWSRSVSLQTARPVTCFDRIDSPELEVGGVHLFVRHSMTAYGPSRSFASCPVSSADEGKADLLRFTLDSRLSPDPDI